MIKAEKIRNKIQEYKDIQDEIKRAEEQKKKQDRINEELLEIEKVINEFDKRIGKKDFDLDVKYIELPIMVSKDVQEILKNEGYFVLEIHNRIENNETRLYFNEKDYKRDLYKHYDSANTLNCGTLKPTPSKLITELNNSDSSGECMVTKNEQFDDLFKNCIIYRI